MLGSPDAKGAGDPPAEFSAGRAMVNVEEVAGEPHPVGSAAMADVADYLAAALERTGAEVDRQDVGDLYNVVARIRGTNSTGVTCGLVRCAPPPSAWASFGATQVVQHPCPIGEHPGSQRAPPGRQDPRRRTDLDPHGRTSPCYGSEGWGFESLRARLALDMSRDCHKGILAPHQTRVWPSSLP
jgi:hypothetical protein